MTGNRQFSDEELTCYLDGEAEPELKQAIEDAAARDSDLEKRLQGLSIDSGIIKSSFDKLLASAPTAPAELQQVDSSRTTHPVQLNYYRAAAIACLVFGLGVLMGRIVTLSAPPNWQDYAAKYHALYVNDTLAVVPTNTKALDTSLARAQSALKHNLDRKALSNVAGLDLKRSQILGFEGRPLIQLAFLSKAGAPVALCIIPNSGAAKSDPKVRKMEGLAAASWSNNGYEFLLIGGKNEKLIRDAAITFQRNL